MRQALSAQAAPFVRGSSRRITIMRFRPANIGVINRRDDRLGRRPHCFPLAREEQRKPKPRIYLTGSSISEKQSLLNGKDLDAFLIADSRLGSRCVRAVCLFFDHLG